LFVVEFFIFFLTNIRNMCICMWFEWIET